MMSVAYTLASGQDFLAWKVKRRVRVLYVDGELPAQLLQERVKLLGPDAANLLFLSRDLCLTGRQRTAGFGAGGRAGIFSRPDYRARAGRGHYPRQPEHAPYGRVWGTKPKVGHQ